MFVLDVYNSVGLTGKQVETILDELNITLNKNQIPNDTLPPLKSSGVRIGTPAMTTKGWGKDEFIELADIIDGALRKYVKDYEELKEQAIEGVKKEYLDKVINLVESRFE